MAEAQHEVLKQVWIEKIKPNVKKFARIRNEWLNTVKTENKYGFIGGTIGIKTADTECNLLEIPFDILRNDIAIIWNKDLRHQHFFNYFINKMKESGLLDKIVTEYLGMIHFMKSLKLILFKIIGIEKVLL